MSTLHDRRRTLRAPNDGDLVAALDIGCSKITCLIARIDSRQAAGFRVEGGGRQQSRGFKAGAVTDMEGLERAVRLAVEDAERQAGQRIHKVRLGVTGPKVHCQLLSARTEPGGREVSEREIRRVQAAALAKLDVRAGEVLSAWPVAYRIDGQEGIKDPRGMIAETVGVLMSVVTAPRTLVDNLSECVTRAHLKVERLVPSALASGFGTMIEDERDNGAICIDMGAGATGVAVFLNGAPAWLDLVPAGGAHITADIAQIIGTTFAAAERLKTVHGQADPEAPGLKERIEVPRLGDDGRLAATRLPREQLVEIITPRVEELFELIATRLESCALRKVLPRRVVLTGGTSEMAGMRTVASRVLRMPVRRGRPLHAEVLGETLASPAFSTAAGLLTYDETDRTAVQKLGGRYITGQAGDGGVVNKTWSWLKENF